MNKILHITFTVIIFAVSFFILWQEIKFKKTDATFENIQNLIYLKLKDGVVVIETFPQVAPKHVARIKELVRSGYYDGNPFFRVITGFVAQTGDPKGTGTGGTGKKLPPEFSKIPHKRGIVSMARASDLSSADSQFFILLEDSEFLDEKYTIWGRVISGMEFVDNIKKAKTGSNGIVQNPDRIISMALAIDIKREIQNNNNKK
jgi:peptidylprolyl isomerase